MAVIPKVKNEPTVNQTLSESDRQLRARRGRRMLIILFALFLAPILAAVFLNSRWTDWQPPPTRNYGQLIVPVLPMNESPLVLADDASQATQPWRLIVAQDGPCDSTCQSRIAELQQVRKTLGRHQDELRLVLVMPEGPTRPEIDAAVWIDSAGRFARMLGERGIEAEGLFLADPLGNLMMRFAPPVDDAAMSKDLDRLISHSRFQ